MNGHLPTAHQRRDMRAYSGGWGKVVERDVEIWRAVGKAIWFWNKILYVRGWCNKISYNEAKGYSNMKVI